MATNYPNTQINKFALTSLNGDSLLFCALYPNERITTVRDFAKIPGERRKFFGPVFDYTTGFLEQTSTGNIFELSSLPTRWIYYDEPTFTRGNTCRISATTRIYRSSKDYAVFLDSNKPCLVTKIYNASNGHHELFAHNILPDTDISYAIISEKRSNDFIRPNSTRENNYPLGVFGFQGTVAIPPLRARRALPLRASGSSPCAGCLAQISSRDIDYGKCNTPDWCFKHLAIASLYGGRQLTYLRDIISTFVPGDTDRTYQYLFYAFRQFCDNDFSVHSEATKALLEHYWGEAGRSIDLKIWYSIARSDAFGKIIHAQMTHPITSSCEPEEFHLRMRTPFPPIKREDNIRLWTVRDQHADESCEVENCAPIAPIPRSVLEINAQIDAAHTLASINLETGETTPTKTTTPVHGVTT